MRRAHRVLGQPCELWIRTGAGEDPGVAFGEATPTLALERPSYDGSPAALGAGVDDLVNEVNKLLWKPNSDLLAHPKTVSV